MGAFEGCFLLVRLFLSEGWPLGKVVRLLELPALAGVQTSANHADLRCLSVY